MLEGRTIDVPAAEPLEAREENGPPSEKPVRIRTTRAGQFIDGISNAIVQDLIEG